MTLREIVPWRWGGLRRWESEEEPVGTFRSQMDALHREMDKLFDQMVVDSARPALTPWAWGRDFARPSIDETEDDKAFYISIELPGMDEKDVDITLSGRLLTIRGEKKEDEKDDGKDYYRRERRFGSFRRTLELPGEVDESKIEASFRKGVLRIKLPRTKEAQSRVKHIDVKAA
ncbi:MAG: Hsp20/alpha crystallin family protein [Woeseiaceae bacterium]|nr:Hsp20/alpha crystallin family protein [Woeseiaceae bacterium]